MKRDDDRIGFAFGLLLVVILVSPLALWLLTACTPAPSEPPRLPLECVYHTPTGVVFRECP